MLLIENIQKSYDGINLFNPVNIQLNAGESVAVSAPNGTGKTTLLLMVLGFTKPTQGLVNWVQNNQKVPLRFTDVSFAGIQMHLFEELTVADHFTYHFKFREPIVSNFSHILNTFFPPNLLSRPIRQLSAGWYNRVKLITALLTKSKVLLLDEPFSNLDSEGIQLLSNAIQTYKMNRVLITAANRKEEVLLCNRTLILEPSINL